MTAVLQPDGTAVGDVSPSLIPLELEMVGCAVQDEMHQNIDATIARGYQGIKPYLGTCAGGAASIVGSGPSIAETHKVLPMLRADVFAINSAIRYLLERKIVPRWAMIWDAADICAEFAVPHPDVTYLIGARCHPRVFERLRGCKVVSWFAGGDHDIVNYMQRKKLDDPLVNGGSAGVTRAMYLVAALGYRHVNIFGADSSYSDEGATHVTGSLVREKDLRISVGNGKGRRVFRTTPEWCSQVNEFRDIYHMFRHPSLDISIDVYGEGMLPFMGQLMRAKDEAGKLWNADGSPYLPTEDVRNAYIGAQLLQRNRHVANARQ